MSATTIVREKNLEHQEIAQCKEIDPSDISVLLNEFSTIYLLIDTEVLLQSQYQPPEPSAQEMPETPTLNSTIGKVDKFFRKRWVWENTKLDEHKENGPVLIECDVSSPLIDEFINAWSQLGCGVLIFSHVSIQEVVEWIAGFLDVGLSSGTSVRLNLESPTKLSCILNGLSSKRLSQSMGPISSMCWVEPILGERAWHQANNIETVNYQDRLFLSEEEFLEIEDRIKQRFVLNTTKQLSGQISENADLGKPMNPSLLNLEDEVLSKWVESGFESALEQGFKADNHIYEYIQLIIFHKVEIDDLYLRQTLCDRDKNPSLRLKMVRDKINQGMFNAA